MISGIIITCCFIGVVILILTDKVNRAIASLSGALITYFTLRFFENAKFSVFIEFLIGNAQDGYVNLHSLILIMGMQFIVQICTEAGVFRFIGFKMIQKTGGKPIPLLMVLCTITVFISAILNNILTVIILIPLTITISRILNINPAPYIITQAVLVNIGGMLFPISSIPNILITTSVGITFAEFFLNVGLISLIIFVITLILFYFIYRKKLTIPEENIKVLKEVNPWNFVQNEPLFYKSIFILFAVMEFLAIIQPHIVSSDIIALSGGIILVIISKLNPRDIISKIDFELLLYLMGIFIIAGGMEYVGVMDVLGNGIKSFSGNDSFISILTILWVSAFLSSSIDNIPITKVLIPVTGVMTQNFSPGEIKTGYYSLAFGANLGDNLTPMGDNILVVNIAERNERPISIKDFFKLGFITTIIQLICLTIYFTLLMRLELGIWIIIYSSILLLIIIILYKIIWLKYREKISLKFAKFKKIKRIKIRKG